jgi:hypothetical protein
MDLILAQSIDLLSLSIFCRLLLCLRVSERVMSTKLEDELVILYPMGKYPYEKLI